MKAAILNAYDKNGRDLEVREVPKPAPAAGEALVRVLAAGVNPLDNMIVRGEVKLVVPYRLPLVMGNELVGVVEELGAGAAGFEAGQRVYCRMPLDRIGAFAEYACVRADALAKAPGYLTDEEAAAVPLTALTAWQSFQLMGAEPGESVFISGGTGSLGAMAIPVAKALGLTVLTNGSGRNRERVLALGADGFVDYREQDYAQVFRDVDYVLDTLGEKELAREFGVLKPGGTLVSLKALPNAEFARRTGQPWYKRLAFGAAGGRLDRMAAERGQRYLFVFVHEDGAGLAEVSRIFEERKVQASVDEVFELADVNEAMRKVAAGGSRGKTVLRIGQR